MLFRNDVYTSGWARIEDKAFLPLKSVYFGDADDSGEYVTINMRYLACEDLQR